MIVFTYLVTKDLVETLERKIGYKLKEDSKTKIKILEDEFITEFWPFIPNNLSKLAISALEVSERLNSITKESKYPIISLDKVYITSADEYLEVTRITDPITGKIKIAGRSGNKSLEEQINKLRNYNKMVLADVGAFEGDTLLDITKRLEMMGVNIEKIYLGFSDNRAYKKINSSKKLYCLYRFDFYEWIELRDLFGIDGRNVESCDGIKRFIPYWENLVGWASISKENELNVAILCKYYNNKLLEILQEGLVDINRIGLIVKYRGDKK